MSKKTLFILLVIIVAIVITTIYLINNNDNVLNNESSKDSIKFKEEYEALNGQKKSDGISEHMSIDIAEENPIKYIDEDEVLNILNGGTGVIYFGMPDCPWCRNAVPVLIDSANELNLSTVYYFNPKRIRDENTEKYRQIIEKLKDYLQTDTTTQEQDSAEFNPNKKRLYVPDVYFVKDGKIIGHNFKTIESHTDPKVRLNDEQYNELKTIYKGYIKQIQSDVCSDEGC